MGRPSFARHARTAAIAAAAFAPVYGLARAAELFAGSPVAFGITVLAAWLGLLWAIWVVLRLST